MRLFLRWQDFFPLVIALGLSLTFQASPQQVTSAKSQSQWGRGANSFIHIYNPQESSE